MPSRPQACSCPGEPWRCRVLGRLRYLAAEGRRHGNPMLTRAAERGLRRHEERREAR